MFGSSGISAADIAAVTRGADADGFGGNNGWWVLIILFALFGGWGRNGYGENQQASAAVGAEVQRGFDTNSIIQKLDGINSGLCSLGYDQLAQMNGINTNILQTGYGLQQAINQNAVAQMQQANALSSQFANCCCENRQGQADLKYTMATDTCAITTAIRQAAQDIMQNDNNNYRQLHDENVAIQMQGYKDRIQQQDTIIQQQSMAASNCQQTTAIVEEVVSRLRSSPIGTFNVPNPNCCYGPWGGMNWNGFYPQQGGCGSNYNYN